MILGKEYNGYDEALSVLNLESLNRRREVMALKFAKNSLKNDNFSKLFPLREIKHEMMFRRSEQFSVNHSKTNRYKDSAVPYLQGLLNRENLEKKLSLKRLISNCERSVGLRKRQRS